MGSRSEERPPKRTQPLEGPSERPRSERESTGAIEPDVTVEASPGEERAEDREGGSTERSGPPKYGGPRDRRRRRPSGPERERTQREYERQMDRQFDRQRDFRVGKGGKKSRRR